MPTEIATMLIIDRLPAVLAGKSLSSPLLIFLVILVLVVISYLLMWCAINTGK